MLRERQEGARAVRRHAVLYVTDMDPAFAVAGAVRAEAYGGRPVVASTILVTPRLALPSQLIEIKLIART